MGSLGAAPQGRLEQIWAERGGGGQNFAQPHDIETGEGLDLLSDRFRCMASRGAILRCDATVAQSGPPPHPASSCPKPSSVVRQPMTSLPFRCGARA
jgi:hypothetical protein